jgi:predicted Zn-dependent protease
MNKRLTFLETLVKSGKADAFARYGLGMEYRKAGMIEEALSAFSALREVSPDYVPQYLMAGQMLIDAGRKEEARGWLEAGRTEAARQGNSHALGELESALGNL